MRLIDADVLGIGKAKREAFTVPEYADGWNAVIDIIAAAPTIDIDRFCASGERKNDFVDDNKIGERKTDE